MLAHMNHKTVIDLIGLGRLRLKTKINKILFQWLDLQEPL